MGAFYRSTYSGRKNGRVLAVEVTDRAERVPVKDQVSAILLSPDFLPHSPKATHVQINVRSEDIETRGRCACKQ